MKRRLVALAGLSVAAGLLATPAPATACDPNRFPNCMTYCQWVAWRYRELSGSMHPAPPPWPDTSDVPTCP